MLLMNQLNATIFQSNSKDFKESTMRINKVNKFENINLDEAIILISGILSQRIITTIIEDIEDEIKSLNIENKTKNNI